MNNIQANCNTDKHLFRDNCLGVVHIIRHAFFICLKRDKNKIVVKLTTKKLHKQKKSRVTYYLNSPLYIEKKVFFIVIPPYCIRHIAFHLSNRAFILDSIQNNLNTKNYSFLEKLINVNWKNCQFFIIAVAILDSD